MASSKQIKLTKQATVLAENTTTDRMLEVLIRSTDDVWIGGTGVRFSDGFKVEAFEAEKISLPPGDTLYGCSFEGTRVYILSTELLITAPTTV